MALTRIKTVFSVATDADEDILGKRSLVYNLFMAVITVYALIVMLLRLVPALGGNHQTLFYIDLILCIIFLLDFLTTLRVVQSPNIYFTRELGFLDLIGSIPVIAIFRLGRLPRLIRIVRYIRSNHQLETIAHEILRDPAKSALLATLTTSILLITVVSLLVLQAESYSPNANIVTEGDAVWWSFVTITTVGYGDYYPVTQVGRILGVVLMIFGVGIFGVLTTYFSSAFLRRRPLAKRAEKLNAESETETLPDSSSEVFESLEETVTLSDVQQLQADVTALRAENGEIKAQLAKIVALLENQPAK
jgi:voltage-gated potassium channel